MEFKLYRVKNNNVMQLSGIKNILKIGTSATSSTLTSYNTGILPTTPTPVTSLTQTSSLGTSNRTTSSIILGSVGGRSIGTAIRIYNHAKLTSNENEYTQTLLKMCPSITLGSDLNGHNCGPCGCNSAC